MAGVREILAGRAAVELTLRDKLKAGLDAAQGRLQKFAVSVAALGISFQTVTTLATQAMSVIGRVFTGPADQLQNLADRTGLTVETLQAMSESGADAGATLEDVNGAARAMANFMQQAEQGGKGASQTLSDLGLSAKELLDASPDEKLRLFMDAIAGIEDPTRRAALAQDVFGRGAVSLLPILASGSGALEAYKQRLKETGALKTADQIAAADNLGDAFGRLSRRLSDIGFSAIAAIAPALQSVTDALVGAAEAVNRFVVANPALAQTLGIVAAGLIAGTVAVAAFTGSVLAAGAVVTAVTAVWGAVTAAVAAFTAVMAVVVTPVGAVVTIAVALAASLTVLAGVLLFTTETGQSMVSSLVASFSALLESVKQVFGGIFDAIASGDWSLAGAIAMAGLNLAMTAGWGKLKSITASVMAWIGDAITTGLSEPLKFFAWQIDSLIWAWNQLAKSIGGTEIKWNAQGFVTGIENGIDAAMAAAAGGVSDQAQEDIAAAQSLLDELTRRAAEQKKAREDALKVPVTPDGGDAGDTAAAVDASLAIARQIQSGTFSATTAGSLARSTQADRHAVEMLAAADAQLEELKEIKKALKGKKVAVGA